jgi:hypothetical protein
MRPNNCFNIQGLCQTTHRLTFSVAPYGGNTPSPAEKKESRVAVDMPRIISKYTHF